MNRIVRIISTAIAVTFVKGHIAFADENPASPTTAPTVHNPFESAPAAASEPDEVKLSVGRLDEYDAVIADLGLTGDQLKAFQAKNVERVEKLKAFVASEDGTQLIALREQLAAARREKQTAEIAPIRAKIKPLSDKYWAIRNQYRQELLSILSEDQLKKYAGYSLYQRTTRGLEKIELSAEQTKKIREICNEATAAWFKPGLEKSDPYLRELLPLETPTKKRILAEVLTDDQKASLKLRSAPPATPQTASPTASPTTSPAN